MLRRYAFCPISLDKYCIVTYYIKWFKTSWTYSIKNKMLVLDGHHVSKNIWYNQKILFSLIGKPTILFLFEIVKLSKPRWPACGLLTCLVHKYMSTSCIDIWNLMIWCTIGRIQNQVRGGGGYKNAQPLKNMLHFANWSLFSSNFLSPFPSFFLISFLISCFYTFFILFREGNASVCNIHFNSFWQSKV